MQSSDPLTINLSSNLAKHQTGPLWPINVTFGFEIYKSQIFMVKSEEPVAIVLFC